MNRWRTNRLRVGTPFFFLLCHILSHKHIRSITEAAAVTVGDSTNASAFSEPPLLKAGGNVNVQEKMKTIKTRLQRRKTEGITRENCLSEFRQQL